MRGVLRFGLTLLAVLIIAWIGLWWYAESRLQDGFNSWASSEAAQGWKISYDAIHRGTSPAHAAVTVDNLVLVSPPAFKGVGATITLPSFALRIDALNPLVMHSDFPDKITVEANQTMGAVLSFGGIAASAALDPGTLFQRGASTPFRSGEFAAANLDVLVSEGSLLVLHIDKLAEHFTFDPAAGASQMAFTDTIGLENLALSPLLAKLASIPFNGKIAHLDYGLSLSGPVPENLASVAAQLDALPHGDEAAQRKILVPVIHQWAAQGGNGNMALNITIGPSTAQADATVKFGSDQQPSGKVDLAADHLDDFSAAIINAYPQFQDEVNQILAQLTPYITASSQTGQSLGLHVTYGPGAVNINGKKVAGFPPVDWNALENPPPPSPAPDDGSGAESPAPGNGQ